MQHSVSLSYSLKTINMSPWNYPEFQIQAEAVHARHSAVRKFCGCMSLRPGCALACALWIGINLYCAILAFRYSSPIFSYLNGYALVIFGAICLLFTIAAVFGLICLFVESAALLRTGHRVIWVVVVIFLMDYFGTIIVFSIEEEDYTTWCIQNVPAAVNSRINSTIAAIPSTVGTEIFNCHKLWEDELKLGIALYIIVFICYLYWAACLWSFAQKIIAVQQNIPAIIARGPHPIHQGIIVNTPHGPPMTGIMSNIKPTDAIVLDNGYLTTRSSGQETQQPHPISEGQYDDDIQKSAAQYARILYKKIKSKLSV
ncbi:hypothetical protein BX666DRAFT_910792 [Dichotomocladium elegans]|nr:hypothetical protein BX666DRAFT_910792 [Dichotomocladium elegans]